MKSCLSGKRIMLFVILIVTVVSLFVIRRYNNVFFTTEGDTDDINDTFVISHLKVCNLNNPIGIDEETPFFSWRMEGDGRGNYQNAYQIMVAESLDELSGGEYLWDSGRVEDSVSVGIPYAGKPLSAKSRYYWQVSVWNQEDEVFTSTEEAFFEMGLMGNGMREAKWISAPEGDEPQKHSAESCIYTIKYDIYVINAEASFIFGAEGGRYGDMYLASISNSDEAAGFRLRRMNGGSFVEVSVDSDSSQETDITFCKDGDGSLFKVELDVENEKLAVNINGEKVGDYIIDASPVGAIGYYKERSLSYAYLDNVYVEGKDEAVIYNEDFDKETNIFEPYYVHVEDGRLRIESGLMLTKYKDNPAPYFYREFAVKDEEIQSARIYMTALGSFSLICNGIEAAEEYFAPGKFVYNQKLTYVSYDVTNLLNRGQNNALGIILLHGWYDRAVGYPEIWNPWGDTNAVRGMLEIKYQDGSTETIVTDENFLCSTDGPVREDDIYQGEFYDAGLEFEGFGEPDFDNDKFKNAMVDAVDERYYELPLIAKENEPIRCVLELTPISVSEPCENVFVYDFGQNFAGTCTLKLKGEKGQIITLRYGEALNSDDMDNSDDESGTIWTQNLLTAQATDYYVLKGDEDGEIFESKYTYHGFRYLQITGLKEALPIEDVKGIVLSSDLEQTGSFECSNEWLNRYYENTKWSQKSNFMDNPTDCPQRDERHGWAGDAQIFSLTASYHADTYNFYRKYLKELRLLQTNEGAFPDMASRGFGTGWGGSGGGAANNCWGDAAVVITWNLYVQYGNKAVIEENYDALCNWMELLISTSDNYIRNQGGYGDHLSEESTPSDLSDTAWCAHSADLISRMAAVLGLDDDAEYYKQIYENYKLAWQNAYVGEEGVTVCDTQTSYALGLAFELFPDNVKQNAADRLALLAEYSGYHINTGYSGIGYLLPALSKYGVDDIAYKFILQEEYPSLLYPVKNGATTTYESLFAYTQNEDGSSHYSGSLNHYAYGAPVSWLYTNVLGIVSDENSPGFHHILLHPEVSDALTYAKGSYESVYGKIEVEWEKTENGYAFDITIPSNTSADLVLPALLEGQSYLESGVPIEESYGVEDIGDEGCGFRLGSGRYRFTVG